MKCRLSDKPCEPYPGPSKTGCVRCGRAITPEPQPVAQQKALRDPYYEGEFLKNVSKEAGFDFDFLEQLVKDKLDVGDREFPGGFLRDGFSGVEEAIDEQIDTIAWLLLELQRRNVLGEDSEIVYVHVYRACVGAASVLHELFMARSEARANS